MLLSDFDYILPAELIAQTPPERREQSRLLVLDRKSGAVLHKSFLDLLDYLKQDDLLVMNDTRVSAVRLYGSKLSGAKVEALLIRNIESNIWEAVLRPARRLHEQTEIIFDEYGLKATVLSGTESGNKIIDFGTSNDIPDIISKCGQVPLPPYVHKKLEDSSRYQTVYAENPGSAAAPTAGFHFTQEFLKEIKLKGIQVAFVTLHVGIATFRPVRTENINGHIMHKESILLSETAAEMINSAKGRIIAVGTTTARVLESAAIGQKKVAPVKMETDLFIIPGYDFKIIDGIVTNFHMPKSTLLMLISAFAGRENVLNAYELAKSEKYRFLSFGDAMFIS